MGHRLEEEQDQISVASEYISIFLLFRKPEAGKESGSAGSGPQAGGRAGSDIRMLQDSNPFDQQTLAMKIKAGLMQVIIAFHLRLDS